MDYAAEYTLLLRSTGGRIRPAINAEPEFWEQFRLIVMERGTTISELLAEIDRKHRLLPYPNATSSSIGVERRA